MRKLFFTSLLILSTLLSYGQRVEYFNPSGQLTTSGTGSVNQVLTISSTGVASWVSPAGGSGVTSFNSRTGAVVPSSGDYTFSQIGSTPTTISGYGITDYNSLGDARWLTLTGGTLSGTLNGTTGAFSANVTAAGRMGIGTTSPLALFHIATASLSTGIGFGVAGLGLQVAPTTITSTSTTGTVANTAVNSFGITTLATSGAATLTNASTVYIAGPPTAGTNVTATNRYALQVASGDAIFSGNLFATTQVSGDNSTKASTTAYVDRNEILLSAITGVNAKTTGTTALYTVPTGKTAVVTKVMIRCTAASAITSGPALDIGVTAGDIYPNTTLTAVTTANKVYGFISNGVTTAATAAQVINLNINTAATGTSQTIEVLVFGILR